MFAILNFENMNPEQVKAKITEVKDTNPSLANMFQSILNKYEKLHDLPLTKIVEPIKITDAKTGKELIPKITKEEE